MPTSLTSLWPGNGSIAERCCLEDVFASGGRASCVNCCHLTARSLGSHIFSLQSTLFSATSGAGRTTFCFLPRSFSSATRAAAYKSREPTPPRGNPPLPGKGRKPSDKWPCLPEQFRGHSVTRGCELGHTLLNNTPASCPLLPTSPWEHFQINCLHPNPCLSFCFWKCLMLRHLLH